MLDMVEVSRVAGEAASTSLTREVVKEVLSEPTTDSDGNEALRLIIVLREFPNDAVNGDSALNAMVRIGQELQKRGEARFPIVEFATESELQADDDPEP